MEKKKKKTEKKRGWNFSVFWLLLFSLIPNFRTFVHLSTFFPFRDIPFPFPAIVGLSTPALFPHSEVLVGEMGLEVDLWGVLRTGMKARIGCWMGNGMAEGLGERKGGEREMDFAKGRN